MSSTGHATAPIVEGLSLAAVKPSGKREENSVDTEFADDELRQEFVEFHAACADLEVVSKRANRSGRKTRKE